MNNIKVMFSRNTDHWETPKHIYNKYMDNGFIDPCPFHSTVDNLINEWEVGKYFINPPYSDIKSWVDKAIHEHNKGSEIHLLVPSRTDTKWFHKLLDYGVELEFIKGRLRFSEKGSAPFPSVIIKLKKVRKMI